MHPETAFALHGMGEVRLAQGSPGEAVRLFEDALRIRVQPNTDPTLTAESKFGLARAIWEQHTNRKRARTLAAEALTTYRHEKRNEQGAVETWLTEHH
jgi:hypothetical protein